jgi:hypothetical protein
MSPPPEHLLEGPAIFWTLFTIAVVIYACFVAGVLIP